MAEQRPDGVYVFNNPNKSKRPSDYLDENKDQVFALLDQISELVPGVKMIITIEVEEGKFHAFDNYNCPPFQLSRELLRIAGGVAKGSIHRR